MQNSTNQAETNLALGFRQRCIPGQPASLLPSSGPSLPPLRHLCWLVLAMLIGPSEVSGALCFKVWSCIPSVLRGPGASPASGNTAQRPQTPRNESVPEHQVPDLQEPGIPVRKGLPPSQHRPTHSPYPMNKSGDQMYSV